MLTKVEQAVQFLLNSSFSDAGLVQRLNPWLGLGDSFNQLIVLLTRLAELTLDTTDMVGLSDNSKSVPLQIQQSHC